MDAYANFDFLRFLGGSCDNVFCGVGRECVEGLTKEPVCDCIERCYEPPSPICASDDVTYDNECEMHRAACSAGTVLRKIADGSCKKGILSSVMISKYCIVYVTWSSGKFGVMVT